MHAYRSFLLPVAAAVLAGLASGPAGAEPIYLLRAATSHLLTIDSERPGVIRSDIAVTGLSASETLVGIDIRPQNGQLYGLGVNATANTASLYLISRRTGFATVVGTASQVAFVDGAAAPVDFPDPATTGWGFDFNPLADRVRVVAGSLNFRLDPNSGAPIDGNLGGGAPAGVNPDGPVNGGTTTVSASAYTNSQPNVVATTLYSLDAASNQLFIQNPPNAGTQVLVGTVSTGAALDFTAVNGFDLPAGVNTITSNSAATGFGYAALSAAGANSLYRINVANAVATFAGTIGDGTQPSQGMAVQNIPPGQPILALNADGTNLVRFSAATPGTTTTVFITGVTPGETLVGLDFRPQTGQLLALGINAAADTGTLYRMDPQAGQATAIGATGQIAFTDTMGVTVDLPDPAVSDYGFDMNPTVDRVRVTSRSGLNFRINPGTGAPVDGNGAAGTQTDSPIQGAGSTGVEAAAYTNSYAQPLTGGVTTLYTLDSVNNRLYIQNPANNGTQTDPRTLTLGNGNLEIVGAASLDIPAQVSVGVNGERARGYGYALLNVGGVTGLYAIDLYSGSTQLLGNLFAPLRALTLADYAETVFADDFE